jgi:CBS domain-containing protein
MVQNELSPEARIYFRDEFRTAVAAAQSDAEGFQEIIFTTERLGLTLTGKIGDLGKYKDAINRLVSESSPREYVAKQQSQWHLPFGALYEIVRDARNDALHNGSIARHITKNAIRLALILEEALMNDAIFVREFMVRDPTCAYLWQPVSLARQQMLANGFTFLPIRDELSDPADWKLLADYQIARYLQSRSEKKRILLAKTIKDAVIEKGLDLLPAKTCRQNQPVRELIPGYSQLPVLVIDDDNPDLLIGILTPFDLL